MKGDDLVARLGSVGNQLGCPLADKYELRGISVEIERAVLFQRDLPGQRLKTEMRRVGQVRRQDLQGKAFEGFGETRHAASLAIRDLQIFDRDQ